MHVRRPLPLFLAACAMVVAFACPGWTPPGMAQSAAQPAPLAQAQAKPDTPKEQARPESTHDRKDAAKDMAPLVSQHRSLAIQGRQLGYTATAGFITLQDQEDKPTAELFYVAYHLDSQDQARRPVTFAFNGGPGSASLWLHLGALGPRRVVLTSDGSPPPPPARLMDNDLTWLPFTDLVFIDPVGTGFSRAIPQDKVKDFFNMRSDVESVGEFIRLYLSRTDRWLSPVFLVGESYGTTRAAALAEHLQESQNVSLSGVILVSPVLDFATISPAPVNDLPYLLALPTYAATAAHFNKLPAPRPQGPSPVQAAETWALASYPSILARGMSLDEEARQAAARDIASQSGLSPEFVLANHLRVPPSRYLKELLRSQNLILGRMDTRLTAPSSDPAGERPEFDPALDRMLLPFAAAANHYLRAELGVDLNREYVSLSDQAARAWDWKGYVEGSQGYVSVSDNLARAMLVNPSMRLMLACGLYDMATPYFAALYTVNHMTIPQDMLRQIIFKVYEGGHMMYADQKAISALRDDAAQLYRQAQQSDQQ